MLKIEHFPHAFYDSKARHGYLAYYYPSSALRDGVLSEENWRYESYSPEILNYKEGRDHDIRRFVEPFLKLIRHSIAAEKVDAGYLVPVPSSIAANDPKFSSQPRKKGLPDSRNRDNRNSVFCSFLSSIDGKLRLVDVLVRTSPKPEKANWTATQQAGSMELQGIGTLPQGRTAIVLVDDVTTGSDTLAGARLVLEKAYPQAIAVTLAIGCTKAPQQFMSLS
jgi:hypothetical protein